MSCSALWNGGPVLCILLLYPTSDLGLNAALPLLRFHLNVTAFACVISASLRVAADNIKLHPLLSNKGALLHTCSLTQFPCGKPQAGIAAEPNEAYLL